MAILTASGVVKRYGGLAAVDGISFEVAEGEIFGIAGPNGAGKTTLFDAVTGIVHSDGGTVDFDGHEIQNASVHHICALGISRTFQRPSVFDSQTVAANVLVGAHFGRRPRWWSGLTADQELLDRTADELAFVGLEDRAAMPAGRLSVYGKKSLMIASALATQPRVLFLDEPFGGMTPSEVDDFMVLLRRINDRGLTIVLIEHVMRALMALSNRVLIMNQGKKLFEGRPSEVLKDPEVVRVYLGTRQKHDGGSDAEGA